MIEAFEAAVRTQLVAPMVAHGFHHTYGPVDPGSRASLRRPERHRLSGRLRRGGVEESSAVELYLFGPLEAVDADRTRLLEFADQDDEVHLTISFHPAERRLHFSGGLRDGVPAATETDIRRQVGRVRDLWLGRGSSGETTR